MPSRSRHGRRLALTCCTGIEELEGRALLSITATAFTDNVLENVASKVELAPFVKDSDPGATLTYELVSTTTAKGGQVSVNAATGLVNYTPAENSASSDSFQYFATDTDSDSSAMKTVTLNLSSVAANPVVVSEVEGQSTINLLIVNLPGAVQDSSNKPSYTFSNAHVANGAGGTVDFTDTNNGAFTYTPSSPTFAGAVIISYQITDGTGTESSTVEMDIGPIAADPVTWGTLSSVNATVPTASVPGLANRIHDVDKKASYLFANILITSGDGTVSDLDSSTGSFTYRAPDATFIGDVTVQYSVSDGTNSTYGEVSIVVAPLITQPVIVTELDHQSSVSLTIMNLVGAVQDVSDKPSYTFSNLRLLDGGGSVAAAGFADSSVGAFTYNLAASASPHPVHIGYSVSDGKNSANGVVTLQLVGIEVSSANFAVLQNATSTLPALNGRILDVKSSPTFAFSSPSVPPGDGTVVFTDAAKGILSYSPPSSTFSGTFPIEYSLTDGTNVTSGEVDLTVAPLVTSPLLIPVAVQTGPSELPSLVADGNVKDIASNPTYTFSKPVIAPGDGTVQFINATTGTLTYTPPSTSFFGVVQVAYTVTDGALHSASGTVIINVEETIRPKNDGPIAAVAGTPLTLSADQLLSNDVASPDGLKPAIGSVGNAINGRVVLNANGSVTFTPTAAGPASFDYVDTDADRDTSLVATVTFSARFVPAIFWANPQNIVYGTPLSGVQLNAITGLSGTFTYSPPTGTVLHVGNGQTLSVVFHPYDSADFTDASATVIINVGVAPPPGLSVAVHSFSGRARRKIGGVIAQLHTSLAKLNARYYSALVNWGDGVAQPGKLTKSGAHGFKLNATHIYRVRGSYVASITVSDRLGDSLTESFAVFVH